MHLLNATEYVAYVTVWIACMTMQHALFYIHMEY